jgi:hypothetical protein
MTNKEFCVRLYLLGWKLTNSEEVFSPGTRLFRKSKNRLFVPPKITLTWGGKKPIKLYTHGSELHFLTYTTCITHLQAIDKYQN